MLSCVNHIKVHWAWVDGIGKDLTLPFQKSGEKISVRMGPSGFKGEPYSRGKYRGGELWESGGMHYLIKDTWGVATLQD